MWHYPRITVLIYYAEDSSVPKATAVVRMLRAAMAIAAASVCLSKCDRINRRFNLWRGERGEREESENVTVRWMAGRQGTGTKVDSWIKVCKASTLQYLYLKCSTQQQQRKHPYLDVLKFTGTSAVVTLAFSLIYFMLFDKHCKQKHW